MFRFRAIESALLRLLYFVNHVHSITVVVLLLMHLLQFDAGLLLCLAGFPLTIEERLLHLEHLLVMRLTLANQEILQLALCDQQLLEELLE